ncbi:MAG: peptidylprolyl isomerase [Chloroflexaceae bacterium]|nr:peptidylprolyl isomerase [Chloroflexaceae bacterium]
MSHAKPDPGGPIQPSNPFPAIASAITVIVVLVLLGVMLANRAQPQLAASSDQAASNQVAVPTVGSTDAITDTAAHDSSQSDSEAVPADEAAQPEAHTEETTRKEYDAMPSMTIDPNKQYTATITTPRGDIVIRLRPDIAPQTVNSFVTLSRDGFYNGLTWHRVIRNFMAQGGDPKGDGTGGPGYNVPAEFTDKILFDRPGIVAMARRGDDINSAGSQFFITTAAYPSLNQQYTIFGEVIEGQDIVNNIPLRDPMTARQPGEKIENITITESDS